MLIKNISNKSYIIKIAICTLAILSFILIIISLIITRDSPSIGYEASIYVNTPIIFWISIIFSLSFGISLILLGLYFNYSRYNLYVLAFLLIFLCYTMLLSLPIIRGYYMWAINGDPATHMGLINQILVSGYSLDNIYPALHIFTAEVSEISGIDIVTLHKLIPLIYGILYLLFMFILIKNILHKKSEIICAILASCVFVTTWYIDFTPTHISNFIFPIILLILYKYITQNGIAWGILSLIMVLLLPTLHPIPSIALGIILIIIILSFVLTNYFKINIIFKINLNIYYIIILCLILFTWIYVWISNFYIWDVSIYKFYELIVYGGPSQLTDLSNTISYTQGYGYDVISYILKEYGLSMLYIIIAFLCIPFILQATRKPIQNSFLLYIYPIIIALGTCVLILYLLNLDFGPLRLIFYICIFCTLLVGYFINKIIERIKMVKNTYLALLSLLLIFIIMIFVFINGILSLYASPYVLTPTFQFTHMEVYGMSWLLHDRSVNIGISTINLAPFRFANMLLLPADPANQNIIPYYPSGYPLQQKVPYHFDYNFNNSANISNIAYLVTTQRDISLYTDIYPQMAQFRFYPEDFAKLNTNYHINRIYSNSEYNVWLVNGYSTISS